MKSINLKNSASISALLEELSKGKEQYDRAATLQCDVFCGRKIDRQPLLLTSPPTFTVSDRWYNPKEIHFDSEKMLINELRGALAAQYGGREAVPSVRAHMGCGIVPSLLGVLPELFEDKNPWVIRHASKETLSNMDISDIKITEEFEAALEHMRHFARVLDGTGVRLYPVDIQGAFDTAHIVYGDDIFYQMYDDPEFVHHLLRLSVAATCLAYDECRKIIPNSDTQIAHYNALVLPADRGIKLSEDTSTLLSKDQIAEFVMPYIAKIFDHTGGGYIHYCGKNPHLYRAVLEEKRTVAINFGNPEKHDMTAVLQDCAGKGIYYYGTVPKDIGETTEEFFKRLVSAAHSENDGKIYLLLQYSCPLSERETVCTLWDRVTGQYL